MRKKQKKMPRRACFGFPNALWGSHWSPWPWGSLENDVGPVPQSPAAFGWRTPANVPPWEIPVQAVFCGYLWVIIPKNPIRERQLNTMYLHVFLQLQLVENYQNELEKLDQKISLTQDDWRKSPRGGLIQVPPLPPQSQVPPRRQLHPGPFDPPSKMSLEKLWRRKKGPHIFKMLMSLVFPISNCFLPWRPPKPKKEWPNSEDPMGNGLVEMDWLGFPMAMAPTTDIGGVRQPPTASWQSDKSTSCWILTVDSNHEHTGLLRDNDGLTKPLIRAVFPWGVVGVWKGTLRFPWRPRFNFHTQSKYLIQNLAFSGILLGGLWCPGAEINFPPTVFAKKISLSTGSKGAGVSGVILGETRQEVHLRKKRLRIFRVLFLAKSSSAAGSSDFGIFGIFDGPRALFGCKSVFQMIESWQTSDGIGLYGSRWELENEDPTVAQTKTVRHAVLYLATYYQRHAGHPPSKTQE